MSVAETLPRHLLLTHMDPVQVPVAAALHAEALPSGFFPRLGRSFLEAYLATYVDDPAGIAIAALEDGQLVGFVVGSTAPATRRSHVLRRHGIRLACRGAAALARDPALALHFLRTRGGAYLSRIAQTVFKRGVVHHPAGRLAVLAHVAVVQAARGTGIGAELVHAFERQAADAGATRIVLVTRAGGGAGRFYRKLGWREEGVCGDRDGVQWTRFAREVA
jgi:GNAT superfamily N-acetyltransferase